MVNTRIVSKPKNETTERAGIAILKYHRNHKSETESFSPHILSCHIVM